MGCTDNLVVQRKTKDITRWLEAIASGLVDLLATLELDVSMPNDVAIPIPDESGSHVSLETRTESHLVGLVAPEPNLWRLVTVFLGLPEDEPLERGMLVDAVGEMTTILAGNLRDVLLAGEPEVHVGLPTFAGGALYPASPLSRGALHLQVLGTDFFVVTQSYALPPARVEYLRMTNELRDREARLRSVLDAAVDGVLVVDDEGRVESSNPAAARLFGREQLSGVPMRDLVPEWAPAAEGRMVRHGHDPTHPTEGLRAGKPFPVELASSWFEVDGRRMHTVFAHDITERRKAETQLRHAQKLEAIGQLASGIAHELNTPLQFVGDNTRFLQDASRDLMALADAAQALVAARSPDASDALVQALRARAEDADLEFLVDEVPAAFEQSLEGLARARDIVRAMKSYAHPDGAEPSVVDVNAVARTCATVSRNEWKHHAELELELDPALPPVMGYQGQLNQVVLNLVVNAAHALERGRDDGLFGRLVLRTLLHDGEVEIQVEDDGCGIPLEAQPRIFEPFFTTKEVGRGTGQGLSLVWTFVVDNHGGRVRFESTPGEGTTFFVNLPAAR